MRSFLCYLLLVATVATYAQSGTTGNLTWSIKDSTLTISGNGAMPNVNITSYIQPWASYRSVITDVVIEHGVTSIGDWAFSDCDNLIFVTIPNSVTFIGNGAFSDCFNLTSIVIPNTVTSIGEAAFAGSGLTFVNIPNSVITIEDNAFSESELIFVTIPNSVISIGNYAFFNCSSLTTVIIGSSVISIGKGVFDYCSNLTFIDINENNTTYASKDGVLFNKTMTILMLYPVKKTDTNYVIPNSVTSIVDGAFIKCTRLMSVTIPNSVISIGNGAFSICTNLTEIINYAATPQTIERNVFNYVDKTKCTLRVLLPFITAYRAAEVWKEFGSIEPITK